MKRAPLVVVLFVMTVALGLSALAAVGLPQLAGPAASPTAPVGVVSPSASVAGTAQPAASANPSASPSAEPTAPPAITDVAVVPVVHFRSALANINRADARAALEGTTKAFSGVVLVKSEAEAIIEALDLTSAKPKKLVTVKNAGALAARLAKDRGLLGFLRADAVGPAVRAIAWRGTDLFGIRRATDPAKWKLTARLPGSTTPFDQARLWTMAAVGDIMLDRGVYRETILRGKGVDFPWNGGRVTITGHRCCTSFDWPIAITKRLGGAGAVKALTAGADLAIANHEGPAPVNARYHTSGTSFTFDQRLLPGLDRAGFDWVSLANNHIGDAGNKGIIETLAALKKVGIRTGGAGKDETAARKASVLTVGGVKVAILARDAIARVYWAGPGEPGSAGLVQKKIVSDIKRARKDGADVVIVFPHWGVEYRATPSQSQVTLARAMVDAGADLVIGNHAHWAAAMEVYKGKPIWYALGNFVFDQTWSEPTQEGLLLELTFDGKRLAQVRMNPLYIMDSAQPNLMDPAGAGKVVMRQVFKASKNLPW